MKELGSACELCGNSDAFITDYNHHGDLKLNEETRHTPGPWEYADDMTVQTAYTYYGDALGRCHKHPICKISPILEHNGPLIAAAPEMFQALEHVEEWITNNVDAGTTAGAEWTLSMVTALIAKAKAVQS